MRLFSRKSTQPEPETYDHENLTPVIRSSICTGEKTAGFRENATGVFHDIMLIRSEEDMDEFRRKFGIDGNIETIY